MPQLNPGPWFMILLFTWIFLPVMMTKIINSSHTTKSVSLNLKVKKSPICWPWH